MLGQWFQCSCEGEEVKCIGDHQILYITDTDVNTSLLYLQLILDITGSISGSRFQGSLICPSCGQLCFVCNMYCAITCM